MTEGSFLMKLCNKSLLANSWIKTKETAKKLTKSIKTPAVSKMHQKSKRPRDISSNQANFINKSTLTNKFKSVRG